MLRIALASVFSFCLIAGTLCFASESRAESAQPSTTEARRAAVESKRAEAAAKRADAKAKRAADKAQRAAADDEAEVSAKSERNKKTSRRETARGAQPKMVLPADGQISSYFGARRIPGERMRFHKGIDICAERGSPVYAASRGEVTFAGVKDGYGRIVEIDHGKGLVTRYAHLDSYSVKPGTKVDAGTRIGKVGVSGHTTGANLHFETVLQGKPANPLLVMPPDTLLAKASRSRQNKSSSRLMMAKASPIEIRSLVRKSSI